MAIMFTRPNPTFFVGCIVYSLKPKTIPELKKEISNKYHEITIEMCQKVFKKVVGTVQNFMEHEGDHVKHLK